jgi:serine/threonine protein kinase
VAGAVKYMHSLGIVHRDLKPENLVYDKKGPDAVLKITDFGLAKFMVHDSLTSETATMKSIVGTMGYMAPEILNNEPYDNKVDLWSLGVLLYVLLCGYPPFYDPTPAGLFWAIRNGSYVFAEPYWNNISKEAKFVVFRLLTVDPETRMTIDELLEHPWINNAEEVAPDQKFERTFSLKLSMFNTRRKLRRSILAVLALNRLASHICSLSSLTGCIPESEEKLVEVKS